MIEAVLAAIREKLSGAHDSGMVLWHDEPYVYFRIDGDRPSGFNLWCACCPGGAYNGLGSVAILDDGCIFLSIKTVAGIHANRFEYSKYKFNATDPDVFNKMLNMLIMRGAAVVRTYDIKHTHDCRKRNEELQAQHDARKAI